MIDVRHRLAERLRVYVVTAASLQPSRGHAEVAAAAVEGGATAVQLRGPELDEAELPAAARSLSSVCRPAGVLFVVNDRLDVAVQSGADGVHLGQGDDFREARRALRPEQVLGVSVDEPEQVLEAEAAGADYLAVTVWPTATKPEARPLGLEGLRRAVRAASVPVVGIGGIHPGNAARVIEAGADGAAVVSAVAGAPDPAAATRMLVEAVGRALEARR